jgi:hypothetical protein
MWWYLHVNMFHYFKIPYFTCTFFTKFIYNEYIGPYFFIARCSTIFASELLEIGSYHDHLKPTNFGMVYDEANEL